MFIFTYTKHETVWCGFIVLFRLVLDWIQVAAGTKTIFQEAHRKGQSPSGNSELHLDLEIAQRGVSAKVQLPNSISLAEDALKRRVT